nr:hypothetical protein [uncultured Prevotella sp.]
MAGFSWQGFFRLADEVIFVVSDISIHIFLLNKDWTFDVCKDERVAVIQGMKLVFVFQERLALHACCHQHHEV